MQEDFFFRQFSKRVGDFFRFVEGVMQPRASASHPKEPPVNVQRTYRFGLASAIHIEEVRLKVGAEHLFEARLAGFEQIGADLRCDAGVVHEGVERAVATHQPVEQSRPLVRNADVGAPVLGRPARVSKRRQDIGGL